MRIIHLSDIHLSKDNIEDFRLYYRTALIKELAERKSEVDIDLIIISGDLVDRGGTSLKLISSYESYLNPYDIFEKEFIDPLCEELKIKKEKFLFIPGNHDIQQNKIDEVKEAGVKSILTMPKEVNRLCEKYNTDFNSLNFERINDFLDFERKYHDNDEDQNYQFSSLESMVIYDFNSKNVGVALINDSWRCGVGKVENHFVGSHQFHRCIDFLKNIIQN